MITPDNIPASKNGITATTITKYDNQLCIIDAAFERVKRFEIDESIQLPKRSTQTSAGYDFCCAEDTVVPSYESSILCNFKENMIRDISNYYQNFDDWTKSTPYTIDQAAGYVKHYNKKMTLVPTGIKCRMPNQFYL